MFLSSLFVVGLLKYLNFSRGEYNSYHLLDLLDKKKQMMLKLANMLTSMFHFNRKKTDKYLKKYSFAKYTFRQISKQILMERISSINNNEEMLKSMKYELIHCKKIIKSINEKIGCSGVKAISSKARHKREEDWNSTKEQQ